MATKLYLRDTANALTGTFPSGEQSSFTANQNSSKAGTLRTLSTTKGSSQVSGTWSTTASISTQNTLATFHCSDTLDVDQTVGTTSETITVSFANAESSLSANIGSATGSNGVYLNLYVWRPSTGALVGNIVTTAKLTGTTEPTATSTEKSNNGTTTSTSAVSSLAGDVIIAEIWIQTAQGSASSFTGTIYYDGATETATNNTTVSDHAAYINFGTSTITFGAPSGGTSTGTSSVTLGAATNTTSGTVSVGGTSTIALGAITPSAAGTVNVNGTSATTLAGIGRSATGTAPLFGNSNVTLAGISRSQAGSVGFGLSFGDSNVTLGGIGFSQFGSVSVTGSSVKTLDAIGRSQSGTAVAAIFGNSGYTMAGIGRSQSGTVIPIIPPPGSSMGMSAFASNYTGTVQDALRQLFVANTVGTDVTWPLTDLWEAFLDAKGVAANKDLTERIRLFLLGYLLQSDTGQTIDDLWVQITGPYTP